LQQTMRWCLSWLSWCCGQRSRASRDHVLTIFMKGG
jgi:hypothetical protein